MQISHQKSRELNELLWRGHAPSMVARELDLPITFVRSRSLKLSIAPFHSCESGRCGKCGYIVAKPCGVCRGRMLREQAKLMDSESV